MRAIKRFRLLALSFLALGTFVAVPLIPNRATALSGSEFRAGRIMDDGIFFNSGSMSEGQIQEFLNAKVPVCDTNGDKTIYDSAYGDTVTRRVYSERRGVYPPFTCLKDYRQDTGNKSPEEMLCNGHVAGNKSAARIIKEVADSCGVSPKVLIILLQKEQSLVTDDWPWPRQYRSATGYGCPDTAPCDAQYYGFFNQVYNAARIYKYYAKYPNSFNHLAGRNNNILYNPSAGCGSSSVYIENQATAGLYNYTPYQPNAAALSNLYGTGDNCSAYGNRNFWRMFNDWFGPTIGPLVRTIASPTLYYTDGSKKYTVGSMELAHQYGLTTNDVRYISQAELDSIPNASYVLSQVVKSDSDTDADGAALYIVSGGKRAQFVSMAQFSSFGFQTSQISLVPIRNLYSLPVDPHYLSNFVQVPSLFVYKIEGAQKRGIFDPATLNTINPSGEVTKLSNFTLSHMAAGQPYIVGDAVLRRSDGKTWLYQDGDWHYIPSMYVYNCWNFGSLKNFAFNSSQAVVPSDTPLSCLAQKSDGTKLLLNRVNGIAHSNSWGFASFSSPLDRTIDRLGQVSIPETSVFRSSASSTLYVFENGKKRPLPDMATFSALGFNSSNIITIDPGLILSIPTGPTKFASGKLFKDSSDKYYIVNDNNKLYISDAQTFENYGFTYSSAVNPGTSVLTAYPTNSNLQMRSVMGTQSYMIESKTRWIIPSDIQSHYGISGSTPAYNSLVASAATTNKTATRFIKQSSSPTIYYLENGQKRPISSWAKLVQLGGENSTITISSWALNQFPAGSQI